MVRVLLRVPREVVKRVLGIGTCLDDAMKTPGLEVHLTGGMWDNIFYTLSTCFVRVVPKVRPADLPGT